MVIQFRNTPQQNNELFDALKEFNPLIKPTIVEENKFPENSILTEEEKKREEMIIKTKEALKDNYVGQLENFANYIKTNYPFINF